MSPLKCRTKVRYRAKDTGRKGHHYVRLAYCGNKLLESKLKLYKGKKKLKKVF